CFRGRLIEKGESSAARRAAGGRLPRAPPLRWTRPSRSPLAPSDHHAKQNSPLSITARPLFQGAVDREGRVQRGAPGSWGDCPARAADGWGAPPAASLWALRRERDQSAVDHLDDAVAVDEDVVVVGDHDDGDPPLVAALGEELDDLVAAL